MKKQGRSLFHLYNVRPDESLKKKNKTSARIRLAVKINDEYRDYKELPPPLLAQQGPVGPSRPAPDPARKMITSGGI